MALLHGFKAHAVWIAQRIRQRAATPPNAPLDVFNLAKMYEIDVTTFSETGGPPDAVNHFREKGSRQVSGFALLVDDRHLIAYNDVHPVERIRSTITHEVSHVVLQHEPGLRVSGGQGCNSSNLDQEAEAAELGSELLIPLQVARRAAIDQRSPEDLAVQFQTSVEVARWRMNMSGGYHIRRRSRAG